MELRLFDIKSYLKDRGIKISDGGKNVSSRYIGIKCMWCGDKSDHLGVDINTKIFKCWRCSRTGPASLIVMSIEKCSFTRAESIMKEYIDLRLAKGIQKERKTNYLYSLPKEATKEFPSIHLDYLKGRNFIPEVIIPKYDLYSCYNLGDYKFRIIIPVIMEGKIVGFTSRDVTNKMPDRYKTSAPSDKWVYNIDNCKSEVIIVEGPTDVWRLGDNTICILGSSFSDFQLMTIKNAGIRMAYILFDAEEEAQRRAWNMGVDLDMIGIDSTILSLDKGDPGEMSQDDANKIKREILG